jgi:RhoGAP domain
MYFVLSLSLVLDLLASLDLLQLLELSFFTFLSFVSFLFVDVSSLSRLTLVICDVVFAVASGLSFFFSARFYIWCL